MPATTSRHYCGHGPLLQKPAIFKSVARLR